MNRQPCARSRPDALAVDRPLGRIHGEPRVRHALTLRDFRLLDAVGGTPTGRAPLARLAEQPAEPENALLDCLVALGRCGLVRSAASHPGAAELTDAGRTRLAEAQQNVPALLRERLAQRLAAAVLTP